uniref:Helicase/UvrB N-terminal domain-containing protein n=1 Tax=viral metagenome TaxID=1070528 RepID=A0A6C0HHC5_9ZZZZ
MDLIQRKLTKAEWTSIEIPVSSDEKRIIELIKDGYANVTLTRNYTPTLLKYMKIASSDQLDTYIYVQFIQKHVAALVKKYGIQNVPVVEINSDKLKKADIIRMSNTERQISENKSNMFEFVLLDLLEKCFKCKASKSKGPKGPGPGPGQGQGQGQDNWLYYYYTLSVLITYNVELFNSTLKQILKTIIAALESGVDIKVLLSMAQESIEKNDYLLKYADETLYEHQKKLFTLCKQPASKLVLYIAPTGTGKTLSPLGLSEGNKIIFVCAARHVGLALAKAAISAGKKVAFAFGCNGAEDIRLHYFAAKEYSINQKSGGIGKVDNTVGDKVEIMISDIQSYLPAMYYMLAFNPKEKIILYWDEPTITMDYADHEFHAIIKKNWSQNLIPNIVLSSATLPQKDELGETISGFKEKFAASQSSGVYEIISYDCKKTIPIINREGFVEMPHYLYDDYSKISEVVKHCKKFKTLLRYIDLDEAVKFILYVNLPEHDGKEQVYITSRRYKMELHFPNVESITMANIKNYYLELLGNLNPLAWPEIYTFMTTQRKQKQKSNINIVTTDAHTLTDGPTIFLADDVEKIAKFYIQNAQIPPSITNKLMDMIKFNKTINEQISILQEELENGVNKEKDTTKVKKDTDERIDPETKKEMVKIEALQSQIKIAMLNSIYVPNTKDHLYKHAYNAHTPEHSKPFTCTISELVVEQIMLIDDVDNSWKLLLLMGIGVFASHKSIRYTEIMKRLAQEQKLYLIIASTDYIYGTNYQFCHGYISKDLAYMSQEKCIQAMGRVGRNKLQHDYSVRFRDNELIWKLFQTDDDKPEVKNMNVLLGAHPRM